MTDWSAVLTFGRADATLPQVVRPSAYAIIVDTHGAIVVVQTPSGLHLPGGGADPGETAAATVERETAEETGLVIDVGTWRVSAIQHVVAHNEQTSFEKRSTFVDAVVVRDSGEVVETDHTTVWVAPADALVRLSRESHRWAVAQWMAQRGLE